MTGPYTSYLFMNPRLGYSRPVATADLSLDWETDRDALNEGSGIAMRYWQRGGGGTLEGTLQSATLYAGSLLAPGESVAIDVYGRWVERSGNAPVLARTGYARRDEAGRLFTDLGTRNGRERWFKGL